MTLPGDGFPGEQPDERRAGMAGSDSRKATARRETVDAGCPALFRSGEPKQGDGADLTALPAVPSPAAPDHERDQFLAWLKSENERRLPFWWRK